MERPRTPNFEPGEQYDFHQILDASFPNEDLQVFQMGKFGPEVRFDPKSPNEFFMLNSGAQMSAMVTFDQMGNIKSLDITRYGGEAGEIEEVFRTRFKTDAMNFIKENGDKLGITSTH